MIRTMILVLTAATLAACATGGYEPDPTTPYQWQQRQERIQREETERLNRCAAMNQQSERYARECQRNGGAPQS